MNPTIRTFLGVATRVVLSGSRQVLISTANRNPQSTHVLVRNCGALDLEIDLSASGITLEGWYRLSPGQTLAVPFPAGAGEIVASPASGVVRFQEVVA